MHYKLVDKNGKISTHEDYQRYITGTFNNPRIFNANRSKSIPVQSLRVIEMGKDGIPPFLRDIGEYQINQILQREGKKDITSLMDSIDNCLQKLNIWGW